MTDGTSDPGRTLGKNCTHDWRIVDTTINQMYGPDRNPTFSLKCRICGAERTAQGQTALKNLSKRIPLGTGLG